MASSILWAHLRRYTRGWRLLVAVLALGAALGGVAWFDYTTSRAEFLALARRQAASLRESIGSAAVVAHAAARDAERQTTEHLLDTARVLADLDGRRLLTPALIDELAARHRLFRITLLDADGSRAHQTTLSPAHAALVDHPEHVPGSDEALARDGGGPGGAGDVRASSRLGLGPTGTALARRLLDGTESEAVSELRIPSSARGARLAAGVRRPRGGAILLSIEASDVAWLHRQSSLDTLLDDIVRTTGDVAYVVLDRAGDRHVVGTAVPEMDAPARLAATGEHVERELRLPSGRVLEVAGPISLEDAGSAELRIGMRLDGLDRAERRTVLRLAVSLASAITLGGLALGLVWLRREYGVLSEQHARARDALQRRDRLAAMGELASTVAHEIRNPLNAIAMSTQRLAQELPSDVLRDEETRGLLDVVQREARRIDGTVQQFLQFARPPRLAPREIDIGPWLVSILEPLAALAAAQQVRLESHTTGTVAVIDPSHLRQAVENIVRNAIEATPAGGHVHVSTRTDATTVEIAVRDTGPGVTPEVLPRIFTLYYTTKPGGTGIGLAVAQQAVTAHGGTIEVETARDRGTTMRIRVPLRPEAPHA
jgi:signal transduction histidine kinase